MRNLKTILLAVSIVCLLAAIIYLSIQLQGPDNTTLTTQTRAQDAEGSESNNPIPSITEIAYISTDTITPSPTVPEAVIPEIVVSPTKIPSPTITPTTSPTPPPKISTLPVAGVTNYLPLIFIGAGAFIFLSFLF